MGILLFIMMFPLIFTLIQIKVNNVRVQNAQADVSKLGFSIGIIAMIRKGKSSFMKGLVHCIESYFMMKIQEEMQECKTILHYLDFNYIDNYCYQEFSKLKSISFYDRKRVFFELIDYFNMPDGIYNDFINNKSLYKIFYRYIDDFYILNFRKCFVIAKNSMYSFITRNFCAYLLDETLDIKEVINNNCYYLERYLCVCYDEKSLDRGNLKSLLKTIERDKGRKELTALCGQIFEETTYFISIKQDSQDEEITERRLCVSNLLIKKRKITNNFYFILAFLRFKRFISLGLSNLHFRFSIRLKKKYGDVYTYNNSGESKYRLKELQCKHLIDYVRSQGVVHYLMHNYNSANDVGKKDVELYEEMKFLFPLKYCIGSYDTHEYSFLNEKLQSMSKYCFMDAPRVSFFKSPKIKIRMSHFLYERKKD